MKSDPFWKHVTEVHLAKIPLHRFSPNQHRVRTYAYVAYFDMAYGAAWEA